LRDRERERGGAEEVSDGMRRAGSLLKTMKSGVSGYCSIAIRKEYALTWRVEEYRTRLPTEQLLHHIRDAVA
jgi:hypothetical protein